jgi:hypothetical protein
MMQAGISQSKPNPTYRKYKETAHVMFQQLYWSVQCGNFSYLVPLDREGIKI